MGHRRGNEGDRAHFAYYDRSRRVNGRTQLQQFAFHGKNIVTLAQGGTDALSPHKVLIFMPDTYVYADVFNPEYLFLRNMREGRKNPFRKVVCLVPDEGLYMGNIYQDRFEIERIAADDRRWRRLGTGPDGWTHTACLGSTAEEIKTIFNRRSATLRMRR